MKLKQKLQNIKSVYSYFESYLITIISGVLISYLMFKFTNFDAMYYGNGAVYAYVQVIVQVLIIILSGVNFAMLWHKLKFSAEFDAKDTHTTTIGSILGVLVSGCPACGITLASYLGLTSILTSLPFFGTELKFIGLALLIYSTNNLSSNMYLCNINRKRKKWK